MQLARFMSSLRPDKKDSRLRSTGIHVPLYVYPGGAGADSYDRIIQTKTAHPLVPAVVTVNPSSGPGAAKDENYARAICSLRDAGIVVIGYVYTSWGRRSLACVAADISRYRAWYGLEGVMIDELSTHVGSVNHYLAIHRYAKSLGMAFVMGNPGTDVPEQFVGVAADNFIIYENAGLPGRERLGGWHADYDKANWSCCSHSTRFDEKRIKAASKYLGLIYATDDTPPNPYDRLSSYFERIVQVLDSP